MFIRDLATSDAMPALAQTLRFAGARQKLIAHNIANISTPDFRPRDVSVEDFREALAKAVDNRRASPTRGTRGELDLGRSGDVRQRPDGSLELRPREMGRNVLFHDRNTRSLESMMQDLVENAGTYRVTAELMRSRADLLNSAIRERL